MTSLPQVSRAGRVEDPRCAGENHHRTRRPGSGRLEFGLLLPCACGQERATQHEQQVGEDRTEHGRLHDHQLAFREGQYADDGLDGISKGSIKQPADGLTCRDEVSERQRVPRVSDLGTSQLTAQSSDR